MAKFATVDEYIAAIPEPLLEVATATRLAIDAGFPEAQAAIRWAHPTWSLGKRPVCYLKAASAHITFGFWRGASIEDSSKRLETSGHVMAHVKLRTLDDVDADLIANWLRQAQELELQAENQPPISGSRRSAAASRRYGGNAEHTERASWTSSAHRSQFGSAKVSSFEIRTAAT